MKKLLVLSMLLLVVSCADKGLSLKITKCNYPDSPNEKAPLWVCGAKVENVAVYAVGSSTKSAAGHNFMKQIAAKNARIELAQMVKSELASSVETTISAAGTGDKETVDEINKMLSKQITDASLSGTRVMQEVTNSKGTLYVLVGYDDNLYNDYVKKVLNNSYNASKDQWNKLVPEDKRKDFEDKLTN